MLPPPADALGAMVGDKRGRRDDGRYAVSVAVVPVFAGLVAISVSVFEDGEGGGLGWAELCL